MKNIFLFLTSGLLLILSGTVSGQQFEFVPDSINGIGTPNAENKFEGPITNLWDQENQIEWVKHENLPDGWTVQICQYTLTCWPDWIQSATLVLPPDAVDKLQIKFYTNETQGVGSVTLDLTPVANPDFHQAFTFTLTQGEDDVQDQNPSAKNRTSLSFELLKNVGMGYDAIMNLPENSGAKLVMYDLNGRKICTIWDGFLNTGDNSISIKPLTNYAGVYFIRLETAGVGSITRQVTLLR